MAGAIQLGHGLVPYRDFWVDKPPLAMLFYLPFGAYPGVPLRVAGAAYALLCCWLMYRFARDAWGGEREGKAAAMLLAFFLVFGIQAAVTAVAPDMMLLAPQIAAVHYAWQRRPLAAGLCAAVGMLAHSKALFILAACALFCPSPWLLVGVVPGLLPLAWPPYWEQVWWWGRVYARNTFVADPWMEGLRRAVNWMGFQAALVIPALFAWREWRIGVWALLMLVSACLGERFFARYYLALLPPLVLVASRAAVGQAKWRVLMLALLLIPAARFGPRYALLAMGEPWRDLELFERSAEVAEMVKRRAQPGETIFVWGYRPEIYVLTRMKLGTAYLESQPLNGVFADRHLGSNFATVEPEFVREQGRRFAATHPDWVVDGLGPLNRKLEFRREDYELVEKTATADIYRWRGR